MRSKINIGIADDHALVRAGFVSLLKSYKFINVVFEAGNGEELLDKLHAHRPEIILLDIAMPVVDGLQVMPFIRKEFRSTAIMVISAHSEPGSILEYVKQGAVSFLPKDCDIEVLVKAIETVIKKGNYFEEEVLAMLEGAGTVPKAWFKERKLTPNEMTVLQLFSEGKSDKEIAEDMKLSVNTIWTYKRILLIKTHNNDLESLVKYAKENGIVN